MKKASLVAALVAAACLVAAPVAASATDTSTPECVPSPAWDEQVLVTPAVPAVEEESHLEYQRYSWTGGPIDEAPTEVPPSENWQPNTTNYEGAGHGTDPVGEPFQRDNPGKGNADWFYWTATKVIDVPGADAIPAVYETVHHEAVTCDDPDPVTNSCTPTAGTLSTNLADLWTNVDTREKGHVEYVDGGLHVWTDDASSQAKVSEGMAVSFPLHDVGVLDLGWSGTTPAPGINLFVDFGADGSGTLVYESVYGQDLWLTNGSSAAVKAKAPSHTGGNGSENHGTIDQWLTVYPDATVTGIAYSLGSGVHGDGVITSITVGCATHMFDLEREVPVQPEPQVVVGEWSQPVVTCDTQVGDELTVTRQVTTTPYRFDEEQWAWVLDTASAEVVTENDVVVVEDGMLAGLECPVVEPEPTPTPTATPAPAAVPVALAQTGGNTTALALALSALALLAAGIVTTVAAVSRRG